MVNLTLKVDCLERLATTRATSGPIRMKFQLGLFQPSILIDRTTRFELNITRTIGLNYQLGRHNFEFIHAYPSIKRNEPVKIQKRKCSRSASSHKISKIIDSLVAKNCIYHQYTFLVHKAAHKRLNRMAKCDTINDIHQYLQRLVDKLDQRTKKITRYPYVYRGT